MSDYINAIPSIYASGQFNARAPFNTLVDENTFYTVEAIRTISEMQSVKLDLYTLVFKPVGIAQSKTTELLDELLKNKACIVTLTQNNGKSIYVPSTYIESFPEVDGVVFEHLCIVSDCGACSPTTKDRVDSTLQAIQFAIEKNLGIKSAKVMVATLPQKSYVSKTQAEAWETSRQLNIDVASNPVVQNEKLNEEIAGYKKRIAALEEAIKQKSV